MERGKERGKAFSMEAPACKRPEAEERSSFQRLERLPYRVFVGQGGHEVQQGREEWTSAEGPHMPY